MNEFMGGKPFFQERLGQISVRKRFGLVLGSFKAERAERALLCQDLVCFVRPTRALFFSGLSGV